MDDYDLQPVVSYLDRLMKKTVTTAKMPTPEEERTPRFRVSSLPYCPITFLKELKDSKERTEPMDYSMRFYTSIGTAVHEALQDYAPLENPTSFCGQWRCGRTLSRTNDDNSQTTCKCTHTKTGISSYNELDVTDCPHGHEDCKPYFHYHELDVEFHGLSGHVDAIVKRGNEYWVMDFKTTGSTLFGDKEAVDKVIAKGYYPSAKYITQIETYCALIEKIHGLPIAGYSICYVSRDKTVQPNGFRQHPSWRHFTYPWTDERRQDTQYRLNREIKGNKAVQSALSDSNPDNNIKHARRILSLKPCVNEDSYKKGPGCKYFGSEKCPFLGTCWQDEDHMVDSIVDMLIAIKD